MHLCNLPNQKAPGLSVFLKINGKSVTKDKVLATQRNGDHSLSWDQRSEGPRIPRASSLCRGKFLSPQDAAMS